MQLVLFLFGASIGVDVVLYLLPFMWRWRKPLAVLSLVTMTVSSAWLFVLWPNALSLLLCVAALYRGFNNLRVLKGRMHDRYLQLTTRRTAVVLIACQTLIVVVWGLWYQTEADRQLVWLGLAVAQVVAALVLLVATIRRLRRTRPLVSNKHFSDAQLPTVTVAIPARNETDDLQECLLSLIASDYPKLEIIVLDDCSQLKRTPEIIRSFAHDGVRFVQGEEPKATWLPKNQAYARLAAEATGEYILFCGVDLRFKPRSIRDLVTNMLTKKKLMVSVLPRRRGDAVLQASTLQAMRYWWELALPRRLFQRPPVLSSCWIVQRKALQQVGGFAAVTRSIVPEAYFARMMIRGDRYSFMRANAEIGIESVKQQADQRETAVRMRYPQLHRRPEQVFLVILAELLLLVLPFVLAIAGWWLPITGLTQVLAMLASMLLVISYEMITITTHVNNWAFGLIGQPIMILSDVIILHQSMWQYEFAVVDWKGRNICIPVMHTYPHLPKI